MSLDNPRCAVALIMNDRGEILAVSRKDNHEDLGLPGGKLEPRETFSDAVVREIEEEVGIRIVRMTAVFDHPDREFQAVTFLVHQWEGEPRSVEGAAVRWVSPSRLLTPECSFRDYNQALFEHLCIVF